MTVVLLERFPAVLFEAFDESSEGLLREYVLDSFSAEQPYTAADVATARQAKALVAAALDAQPATPRLRLRLSAGQAAAFPILQAVLDHANSLARNGQLLALPVLPEIAAFRNWLCDQVVAQANGGRPSAWELRPQAEEPGAPPATWEGMAALPADQAWLVGDDANRIIGASPAALQLLQWDRLVGERILAIIPERLREQHISAFTRAVLSDHHRLLGQPLEVAARTRGGAEVPVTMTLSQHAGSAGRCVYLAELTPR